MHCHCHCHCNGCGGEDFDAKDFSSKDDLDQHSHSSCVDESLSRGTLKVIVVVHTIVQRVLPGACENEYEYENSDLLRKKAFLCITGNNSPQVGPAELKESCRCCLYCQNNSPSVLSLSCCSLHHVKSVQKADGPLLSSNLICNLLKQSQWNPADGQKRAFMPVPTSDDWCAWHLVLAIRDASVSYCLFGAHCTMGRTPLMSTSSAFVIFWRCVIHTEHLLLHLCVVLYFRSTIDW